MAAIITVWLLCIIVLGIVDLKYAMTMYIPFFILIPYNIGNISTNLVCFSLLSLYYFKYRNNKISTDWRPFYPFIVYFVFHLFLALFQEEVPFSQAFDMIRNQVILLIIPFLIWNTSRQDRSAVVWYRNATITCILIAAIYGLLLTQTVGINPYIIWMNELAGKDELREGYLDATNGGRLFGRISSVFNHPMSFGLFLGFACFYLIRCRNQMNTIIKSIGFVVIIFDILFCGVRSVILAIVLSISYWLLIKHQIKNMLLTLVLGVIGYNVVLLMPELSDYLSSVADYGSQSVEGSSIGLRLEQLEGCINEIKNCPLVGHGFQWCNIYMSKFDYHPVIMCFESLLFMVLCNTGYVGLAFWIYFIYLIYRNNQRSLKNNAVYGNTILVFYISYSCITGEYNYMKMFLLFYSLIICESFVNVSINSVFDYENKK